MSLLAHQARLISANAGAFANEVLSDSPWLWWRLGELTGATIADSSGNGLGGALNASTGPPYELGQAGLVEDQNAAIRISGATAYIRSDENFPATALAENTTISIAVRVDEGASAGSILGLTINSAPTTISGSRDRALYVDTNGALIGAIWNGATTRLIYPGINDGDKHLIHLVQGPEFSAGSQLYVDGVLVDSVAGVSRDTSGPRYFYVGSLYFSQWPNGPSGVDPAVGIYDEVAIYQSALSPERIHAQARAGGFA